MLRVTYLRKGRSWNPLAGHWGERYYFRAVDSDTGARYYGTSPGPGMYARVHRAKRGGR